MDLSEFSFSTSGNNGSWQEAPQPPHQDDVLEAIPVVVDELDGGWSGKICLSVFLVLGTFGNLMTITILRRLGTGWSAMNVYFTGLAVSDTTMLYTMALPLWIRKVVDFDVLVTHVAACKGLVWLMNTSAASSAWLLVALTAQRAASVVWPHRVNVVCTRRKSIVIIIAIAVTVALLYSHILYGYQIINVENGTSVRCSFGFQAYQQFWVEVWVRTDIFIYSLLPCVCLIVSNAVLVWRLAMSLKEACSQQLSATKEEQRQRRKRSTSSTTLTIISVSTAFVVVTLPLMVYNIFFYEVVSKDKNSKQLHYFLYDFVFMFCLINFAWNFYLYCLTGTKFRQEFLNIVLGCCGRKSSRAWRSSTEGTHVSGAGAVAKTNSVLPEHNDEF